jgi:hypothetical protein
MKILFDILMKKIRNAGSLKIKARYFSLDSISDENMDPSLAHAPPSDPVSAMAFGLQRLSNPISPKLFTWLDLLSDPPSHYSVERDLKAMGVSTSTVDAIESGDTHNKNKENEKAKVMAVEVQDRDMDCFDDEDCLREVRMVKREACMTDSVHRITMSIAEKRYPVQICSVDNPETNTKATIWADMKTREVSDCTLCCCLSSPF